MSDTLTARQQEIFDFIQDELNKKGYAPSVREIGKAVGLSSPSTVQAHLKKLEEKGYIHRDTSKPRALVVTHDEYLSDPQMIYSDSTDLNSQMVDLPLLGEVAAGQPMLAEENIEDIVYLPVSFFSDDNSFILQVKGDSMIEIGIYSGDYIVVKQSPTAQNGDIVVALIDDEATVKTYYKEKDRIRLQPQNKYMEPIYSDHPKILGIVTGLFRTF